MAVTPGGCDPRRPRRPHAPLSELPVLQLQVAMQCLEAAVLSDEGLVLRGLALVQRGQMLMVLHQGLVGRRQPLLLPQQVLVLALLGRLLVLQLGVLRSERGVLGAQGGVLHLPRGRRGGLTEPVSPRMATAPTQEADIKPRGPSRQAAPATGTVVSELWNPSGGWGHSRPSRVAPSCAPPHR